MFELKTHVSKLLERVERGQVFYITRRGKRVAMLTSVDSDENEKMSRQEVAKGLNELRKRSKPGPESMKELINIGRKW